MKKYIKLSFLLIFVFLFIGCGASKQTIYNWNASYIDSVYNSLNDENNLNKEISEIEKYINETTKEEKKLPPGVYAQLGLLYSKIGNNEKALFYLDKEKEIFPESKEYINFLKNKGRKNEK